ncbi:MAG: carboxypeptidase-like regulatory domain-containing protein [Bacteroidales bacterium]
MNLRSHISLIALISSLNIYSQIEFSGTVVDKENNVMIGTSISETINNRTISDKDGKFKIIAQNSSSKIKFEYIGYKTLVVKIDTINQTNYKAVLHEKSLDNDFVIYAPIPRGFGIGYYGLTSNQPIGFQLSYWTGAGKFQSYFNFATRNPKSNYYDFEIGPYGLSYSGITKYLSPYLKEIILQQNNVVKSKTLLCDRICISNSVFHAGVGVETETNMSEKIIFLAGLKQYLNFLPLNPFFSTSIACDLSFNGYSFDYISGLKVEFYNRNYKNISVGVGYQSVYSQKDLVINLNYKHYFTGRRKSKK